MAEYAKIFTPKDYDLAGTQNLAEMSASLSNRTGKVIDKLPVDESPRFRTEVEKYQTWSQLPPHLKDQITSLESQ